MLPTDFGILVLTILALPGLAMCIGVAYLILKQAFRYLSAPLPKYGCSKEMIPGFWENWG